MVLSKMFPNLPQREAETLTLIDYEALLVGAQAALENRHIALNISATERGVVTTATTLPPDTDGNTNNTNNDSNDSNDSNESNDSNDSNDSNTQTDAPSDTNTNSTNDAQDDANNSTSSNVIN